MEHSTQHSSQPPAGIQFPERSTAFAVVKSTGIGAAIMGGLFYGIQQLAGKINGKWESFVPSVAAPAAAGIFGGLTGWDRYNRSKAVNHRAETLNKYSTNADIQNDILSQTGAPEAYMQRRGFIENAALWTTLASGVGYLLSDKTSGASRFTNILRNTSGLSGIAWLGSHLIGVFTNASKDSERLAFAEKVALEREGQRVMDAAQKR